MSIYNEPELKETDSEILYGLINQIDNEQGGHQILDPFTATILNLNKDTA